MFSRNIWCKKISVSVPIFANKPRLIPDKKTEGGKHLRPRHIYDSFGKEKTKIRPPRLLPLFFHVKVLIVDLPLIFGDSFILHSFVVREKLWSRDRQQVLS